MFPLTNNEPYIESSGERTTLGDMFAQAGGDISELEQKIDELKEALTDEAETRAELGAHNILPFPYYRESGYSSNGLIGTYSDDGIVTINKTTNENAAYFVLWLATSNYFLKPSTKYILSAETTNATSGIIFLTINGVEIGRATFSGSGYVEKEITTPASITGTAQISLWFSGSDTETNCIIKPMVRTATDSDTTYQSYAMTNKELTDKLSARLVIDNQSYTSVAAETFEYTGISFVLDKPALVQVYLKYQTSNPKGLAVSVNSSNISGSQAVIEKSAEGDLTLTTYLNAGTKYVWAKFASADKTNAIDVRVLMTF